MSGCQNYLRHVKLTNHSQMNFNNPILFKEECLASVDLIKSGNTTEPEAECSKELALENIKSSIHHYIQRHTHYRSKVDILSGAAEFKITSLSEIFSPDSHLTSIFKFNRNRYLFH